MGNPDRSSKLAVNEKLSFYRYRGSVRAPIYSDPVTLGRRLAAQ